jgi:hypothetical protein
LALTNRVAVAALVVEQMTVHQVEREILLALRRLKEIMVALDLAAIHLALVAAVAVLAQLALPEPHQSQEAVELELRLLFPAHL